MSRANWGDTTVSVSVTAVTFIGAGPTDPLAPPGTAEVAFRERMPLIAVGLCCVDGTPPLRPQVVESVRDSFEVLGVHTATMAAVPAAKACLIAVVTQVVECESGRDRTDEVLVHDAMRLPHLAVKPKLAVAGSLDRCGPNPATGFSTQNLCIATRPCRRIHTILNQAE